MFIFILGVGNDYPSDTPVVAFGSLTEFNPIAGLNHFDVTANLELTFVDSHSKLILETNSKIDFNLQFSYSENGEVNFFMEENSFSVVNTIVDKKFGLVKTDVLATLMTSMANMMNNAHPMNLFQKGISTKAAFRRINSIIMKVGDGMLITGEPNKYDSLTSPKSIKIGEKVLNLK